MTGEKSAPHSERAHAILSASGAHRWLACTPSARLEEPLPDTTSVFAEEGTFAHELGEIALKKALGEDARRPRGFRENPHYAPEMEGYLEEYVTAVMERISAHRAHTPDPVIMLEQRLDFSMWVPEGFGSGDVVIVSDLGVEVIDLKYGKGLRVEAEGNEQLRLYGLGALSAYDYLYDCPTVTMTIIQPRLDHISSASMPSEELLRWADEYVVPRARLAWEGAGEAVPGDHCRFCKIRSTCRARAEANIALAKHDFAPANTLTIDEIAAILKQADDLVKWAGDVKGYALEQARDHGVIVPGYKLVEGRSNRKIIDEDGCAEALIKAGFPPAMIYRAPALQTITALEKAVGKKPLAEVAGEFIVKPEGAPTLVPEDDKRPALASAASAQSDFGDGE